MESKKSARKRSYAKAKTTKRGVDEMKEEPEKDIKKERAEDRGTKRTKTSSQATTGEQTQGARPQRTHVPSPESDRASPSDDNDYLGPPKSIYLPYQIQHTLLSKTQALLEISCFNFAESFLPDLVQSNRWDCAEAIDLSGFCKILLSDSLPPIAARPMRAPLTPLLTRVQEIQHKVARRTRDVSLVVIESLLKDGIAFSYMLCDNKTADMFWGLKAVITKLIAGTVTEEQLCISREISEITWKLGLLGESIFSWETCHRDHYIRRVLFHRLNVIKDTPRQLSEGECADLVRAMETGSAGS